jgi:hypothetical protein
MCLLFKLMFCTAPPADYRWNRSSYLNCEKLATEDDRRANFKLHVRKTGRGSLTSSLYHFESHDVISRSAHLRAMDTLPMFPPTQFDKLQCLPQHCRTWKSRQSRYPPCRACSVGPIVLLFCPSTEPLLRRTGVYLVLFVLAIWSTHRQGTVTSKRLRWVTIALYVHAALDGPFISLSCVVS